MVAFATMNFEPCRYRIKEGYKKDVSYLLLGNVFGGVLVAPHSDRYVIVDLQVASPSAKPA